MVPQLPPVGERSSRIACREGIAALISWSPYSSMRPRSAAVPNFLIGDEFDAYLAELEQTHIELFRETGQLVNE